MTTGFDASKIDVSILDALRRGDRKAREIVYRTYSGAVHTLASRVLRDPSAAEEVTQDTFIDVFQNAAKLEDDRAFGGWMRSIAMNHCLMRLRSPWHRRRGELTEEPAATDGIDRAIDVERALARLTPTARLIVWMHCVEGCTHDEIGAAFGKTASFSKSRLARAMQILTKARFEQTGSGNPSDKTTVPLGGTACAT